MVLAASLSQSYRWSASSPREKASGGVYSPAVGWVRVPDELSENVGAPGLKLGHSEKLEPLTEAASQWCWKGEDTRGPCKDRKDLPERRGSGVGGEMEPKPGSQLRLPVAEDDLEPPAFYLTNAEIIGICCQ